MDLSALSKVTTAATSLSNLILVSPQDIVGMQPQLGPSYQKNTAAPDPAFLFHYDGEQTVNLESDITDHYIEDNSAVQDQVALKPEIIRANGFIGELNDVVPKLLAPLKTAAEKLTVIGAYTPGLSLTAVLAYQQAAFLYQVGSNAVDSAVSAWSSINGTGGQSVINGGGISSQENQNKQQVYFQRFYGYWRNRTLFTVQTPWAVFQDMAIKSLRAIQDSETRMITNFEIEFKIMRFASTQITETQLYDTNSRQGRNSQQAQPVIDRGLATPKRSATSLGKAYNEITKGRASES